MQTAARDECATVACGIAGAESERPEAVAREPMAIARSMAAGEIQMSSEVQELRRGKEILCRILHSTLGWE